MSNSASSAQNSKLPTVAIPSNISNAAQPPQVSEPDELAINNWRQAAVAGATGVRATASRSSLAAVFIRKSCSKIKIGRRFTAAWPRDPLNC